MNTAPNPPRACGRRTRKLLTIAGRRADGVGCRAINIAVLPSNRGLEPTWPRVAPISGSPTRRAPGSSPASTCRPTPRPSSSPRRRRELPGEPRTGPPRAPAWRSSRSPRTFEVFRQALGFVERPGLEGVHQLTLIDDAVLKREQSEEQMAVGGSGHGESPGHGGVPVIPNTATGPSREGSVATRVFSSHARTLHAYPLTVRRRCPRSDLSLNHRERTVRRALPGPSSGAGSRRGSAAGQAPDSTRNRPMSRKPPATTGRRMAYRVLRACACPLDSRDSGAIGHAGEPRERAVAARQKDRFLNSGRSMICIKPPWRVANRRRAPAVSRRSLAADIARPHKAFRHALVLSQGPRQAALKLRDGGGRSRWRADK